MFSYVFMKILESRPARYDRGSNILTGGHANKVKNEIIATLVKPDIRVLDVGCGTGQLLAQAARRGAKVTGIDISEGMLTIARKRFESGDLKGKGTFYQAGVTELDTLFADDSFDLITATLVFSELHRGERHWALREFARILKPSGVLVLADEVRPKKRLERFIHFLVRFPLALITYLLSQITTNAVPNMVQEVLGAGFEVFREKRSLLGSFAVVFAMKHARLDSTNAGVDTFLLPEDDISALKTIWDFIGRWFPNPVEPGLRKIGNAGTQSPVFITGNFHLTVRRVEKALFGTDSWLLIAPTQGINVWCASSGGEMTEHSIISAMKTSRLEDRVVHRNLILPQLCAPGVNRKVLEELTGWKVDFGPVYARDISNFIQHNNEKSTEQRIVHYPLSFRLEMLFCMNALVWLILAVIASFVNIGWVALGTFLFWGAGLILYAGFPYLPGSSGWWKAALLSIFEVFGITLFTAYVLNLPWWTHWGWIFVAVVLTLWLGFDLKGIVGGNLSEAESLMHKLGFKSVGRIFSAHPAKLGSIRHDRHACTNCLTCLNVCPKGVYSIADKDNQINLTNAEACFNCNACIKQCPSEALSFDVDKAL